MENQVGSAEPVQDKPSDIAQSKSFGATQGKPKRIAKIMIDRNLCIGNASCVAVMPSAFELDPENKAVLRRKNQPPTSDTTRREDLEDQTSDDETLLLAAKSCPTQAIFLYDEDGNQIFP